MTHHTTNDPYFPENLQDYAPWVAKRGLLAPYGECQCGCGQQVNLATKNHTKRGMVIGEPIRYIVGHGSNKPFIPFDVPSLPPNTQAIFLTRGKVAIIDDCDADLAELTWTANPAPNKQQWYAKRTEGHRGPTVLLHRVIANRMGILIDGIAIDHINGNSLDNRRSNLRVTTSVQNAMNSVTPRNNLSGYKGVCWHERDQCWMAYINRRHLGYFDTAKEAAKAYNQAALELHGEFARLNNIE